MARRLSHAIFLTLLVLASSRSYSSYIEDYFGGWTQRLGLSYSDKCQEQTGLGALFSWVGSIISGRQPQRSANCETKEMSCPAGMPATGLQVRSGHRSGQKGNRELYDFRLRCGEQWQSRL